MIIRKKFNVYDTSSFLIFLIFIMFIIYPLFNVLKNALIDTDGHFTIEYFKKFFGQKYYVLTLLNSIKVAVCVMCCSLFLGIPLAYFNTIYDLKGSIILQLLIILCSMSAPFVGAYSWILLFGRGGAVTVFFKNLFGINVPNIYGFSGIVLVMTTKMFPLVYLYVSGALKNFDRSLLEAAANIGCTGKRRFFYVVLPLCMPAILAVSLMVFIRAMADFGTPLLIGEGYRTFSVEIYKQYVGESGTNHNFAAAISVIAIIITGLFFFIQKKLSSCYSFSMSALHPIKKIKAKWFLNIIMHVYSYILVAISFLPQLYLIYTSFRKTSSSGTDFIRGYSLRNYELFFKRMWVSVPTTLYIGILTLIVTICMAVLVAYLVVRRSNLINNMIDTLSMVPYIIPGSVIGISLVMAYNSKPLVLTGTVIIMIIAISIRRIPYTIRSSVATLQQIPLSVEEAAESLGISKGKILLQITVPMMSNGIIAGAILSWITILTELSSSIILYSAKSTTLTLATYIFVSRGNYGAAAASASILTMFTSLSLFLFFSLSKNKELTL